MGNKKIKLTTAEFIVKAIAINGGLYNYSLVNYTHAHGKVEILCNIHGSFLQSATSHLSGVGCPVCGRIKSDKSRANKNRLGFVQKCEKIHPTLSFKKTVYKNPKIKVIVICPIHGEYATFPYNVLKGHGCNSCSVGAVTKKKRENGLLDKCSLSHNNFYDYSLVDLSLPQESLQRIICPIHGEFKQSLQHHKRGHKCAKCAVEMQPRIGFSLSQWKDYQNNRIARVYFVRLYNDTESFYKVGITYQPLKRRLRQFPYEVEIINVKEYIDAVIAFKIEKRFKKMFKSRQYKPMVKFGGWTECYLKSSIKNKIYEK